MTQKKYNIYIGLVGRSFKKKMILSGTKDKYYLPAATQQKATKGGNNNIRGSGGGRQPLEKKSP